METGLPLGLAYRESGSGTSTPLPPPPPPPTAPSAFTSGQWSLTDPATSGELTVTVSALPSDGGSSITDIEYRVDGGSWVSSGESTTGSFDIAGLTDDVEYDVELRAVSAIGNSPASDVKSETPTAPAIMPLRVIGVFEQIPINSEGRSGRNRQATRMAYRVGQDASDFVFAANNWWQGSTSEGIPATSITIEEAALESPGGTVVPIFFGGNRNITLAAGDNNIQSDPVAASAFSLSQFDRDSDWWVKMIVSVPAAGNVVPYVTLPVGDVTGQQCLWYDSGTVTLDADVAGLFPTASTEARTAAFRLMMLGHPVTDERSFITIGDSISAATGDTLPNDVSGRGMVQRAMSDAGVDCFPSMLMSRSGATVGAFKNLTRWRAYIPYARHAIDQVGTNSVSGATVAALQADLGTIWGHFRADGIEKIIRTDLLVRTSSTDNWATTANQTPNAGWENGGKVTQLNTWFPTKVADSTIDYHVALRPGVADGTVTDAWATPKLYNADDVHPNNAGHVYIAATFVRPVLEDVGLA